MERRRAALCICGDGVIRSALRNEAEVLLAIQRDAAVAAFAHIFPQDRYPFPSDEIGELWRRTLEDLDVEVYLAEIDEVAVGSVSVGGELLRTLYVRPSRQSTGIGSALHDYALERLRARGVRRAKLWTLEQNWRARQFYERRGWSLTGEVRIVPFPPHPSDVQYERELR